MISYDPYMIHMEINGPMESRCGADVVNQTWINLAIFQRAILAGKLPSTEYQSNKNRLRNFLRHVAFFLEMSGK